MCWLSYWAGIAAPSIPRFCSNPPYVRKYQEPPQPTLARPTKSTSRDATVLRNIISTKFILKRKRVHSEIKLIFTVYMLNTSSFSGLLMESLISRGPVNVLLGAAIVKGGRRSSGSRSALGINYLATKDQHATVGNYGDLLLMTSFYRCTIYQASRGCLMPKKGLNAKIYVKFTLFGSFTVFFTNWGDL